MNITKPAKRYRIIAMWAHGLSHRLIEDAVGVAKRTVMEVTRRAKLAVEVHNIPRHDHGAIYQFVCSLDAAAGPRGRYQASKRPRKKYQKRKLRPSPLVCPCLACTKPRYFPPWRPEVES